MTNKRLRNVSPSVAIVAVVVLICAFIGMYGWLSIRQIDTTEFLYIFGSVIGTNVGIIFNLLKTGNIEKDVQHVVENTNGTLSKLVNDIPQQVEQAVANANGNGHEETMEVKSDADKHHH